MLTYLSHPKHGIHIAYSQTEIDACVGNGWSVLDKLPVKTSEPEIERKKPGPKPKVWK